MRVAGRFRHSVGYGLVDLENTERPENQEHRHDDDENNELACGIPHTCFRFSILTRNRRAAEVARSPDSGRIWSLGAFGHLVLALYSLLNPVLGLVIVNPPSCCAETLMACAGVCAAAS